MATKIAVPLFQEAVHHFRFQRLAVLVGNLPSANALLANEAAEEEEYDSAQGWAKWSQWSSCSKTVRLALRIGTATRYVQEHIGCRDPLLAVQKAIYPQNISTKTKQFIQLCGNK